MIKTKHFMTAALLLTALSAQAVPAKRVTRTVTLPGGQTVELTLRGDEHYSYYTDPSGNAFSLQKDGTLRQLPLQEVSSTWTARKQQNRLLAGDTQGDMRHGSPRRAGIPSNTTTGKQRGLVILMQYPDVPFTTENPQQTFQRFFNEAGYNDGGMAGSVRDYFLKQSYGQLEINFDVVGPYTTSEEMASYGAPTYDGTGKEQAHDSRAVAMIAEAVDAAAKDVNYANYDWDNDGVVDQVFVIYAGYNEAEGADANTIWPHEWKLSARNQQRTYNGKRIDTYGCSSELMGDGVHNTGIIDGIGTACHEFSHCLGLPDMYDTSDSDNFGMNAWDIMDYGSYNNSSRTPAGYTSYERWFARWLTPVELNSFTRINGMKPLATTPEAYILYNDANKDEYYLLENRQPVDFDASLGGHGLLVLHVDYNEGLWTGNGVNNTSGHERMTVVAADNNRTRNTLAGDPWPGTSGNTALTNYTTPAATLFNANADGQKLLSKPLDNITEDAAAQTVSFVACRAELGIPAPDGGTEVAAAHGFTITWPAVTGAVGYEIELTTLNKAATNPSDALQREFDFSACVSKSNGLSDISSKLSSYGLSGWSGSKLYTSPSKLRIGTSSASGNVTTPTWQVPQSTNLTVVVGADVVKAGTLNGTLELAYANNGESKASATKVSKQFSLSGSTKMVFQFSDIRKSLFYLTITPSAQMYLNYLAVYDGTWTPQQLGLSGKAYAPQRANTTVQTYTSETNSYTFQNMDATKRYAYRVRAIGEEQTYSQWSEEKSFEFSAAGIETIDAGTAKSGVVRYYDLQGREVGADARGLVIRRQGSTVQKVLR